MKHNPSQKRQNSKILRKATSTFIIDNDCYEVEGRPGVYKYLKWVSEETQPILVHNNCIKGCLKGGYRKLYPPFKLVKEYHNDILEIKCGKVEYDEFYYHPDLSLDFALYRFFFYNDAIHFINQFYPDYEMEIRKKEITLIDDEFYIVLLKDNKVKVRIDFAMYTPDKGNPKWVSPYSRNLNNIYNYN